MILTIKKEHTGKNNYQHMEECPIAQGLMDRGYRNVIVGLRRWEGTRRILFFNLRTIGTIPYETTMVVQELARTRRDTDTQVRLD